MTVSSSVAAQMTVDEVVLYSYQLAGLVSLEQGTADPGWAVKSAFGRKALNIIVGELATEGVFARFLTLYDLTLTADDDRYTLPTSIAEVFGDAAYIAAGEDAENPTSESVVKRITQAEWQGLSARSGTSSQPTLYFPYRGTSGYQIELRLWQTPSEAGTLRLQTQRYHADTLDGGSTIDLEPYWLEHLTTRLTYKLGMMSSLPSSRLKDLSDAVSESRNKARGKANEGGANQPILSHTTGWGTR